jgi:hypothetical protein
VGPIARAAFAAQKALAAMGTVLYCSVVPPNDLSSMLSDGM